MAYEPWTYADVQMVRQRRRQQFAEASSERRQQFMANSQRRQAERTTFAGLDAYSSTAPPAQAPVAPAIPAKPPEKGGGGWRDKVGDFLGKSLQKLDVPRQETVVPLIGAAHSLIWERELPESRAEAKWRGEEVQKTIAGWPGPVGPVANFWTQAALDPLNIVGAGFATKALKARGLTRLAKANQVADVVQGKAVREVLGATGGYFGNVAAGGEEETGLKGWEAAALGALAGHATRYLGRNPARAPGVPGMAGVEGPRITGDEPPGPRPEEPPQPGETFAFGTRDTNKRYRFRWTVREADDITPSNTDTGDINPSYPGQLQPRDRTTPESKSQVDRIARELSPDALIEDVKALDRGAPIVGRDGVVESGNGRILAIRRAMQQYPDQYKAYVSRLIDRAQEMGLNGDEIAEMDLPVLVRERLDELDDAGRFEFVKEANERPTADMTLTERAYQERDAIHDADFDRFAAVGDEDIFDALNANRNREFVQRFLSRLTEEERRAITDQGRLTQQGADRITAAMFAKTFPSDTGKRLLTLLYQSSDETVQNAKRALEGMLPRISKMEAGIRAGAVEGDYTLADDIAAAVAKLNQLRSEGMKVEDFLAQKGMFVEDDMTPMSKAILAMFEGNKRSSKRIREILGQYLDNVDQQPPPGQMGMFGEGTTKSREELMDAAIRATEHSAGPEVRTEQPGMFRPTMGGGVEAKPSATAPGQASAMPVPEQSGGGWSTVDLPADAEISSWLPDGVVHGVHNGRVTLYAPGTGGERYGQRYGYADYHPEDGKWWATPKETAITEPFDSLREAVEHLKTVDRLADNPPPAGGKSTTPPELPGDTPAPPKDRGRTTLPAINKRLFGTGIELVKGDGYMYFAAAADATPEQRHALGMLMETSVPVPRVTSLTPTEWLQEAQKIIGKMNEVPPKGAEDVPIRTTPEQPAPKPGDEMGQRPKARRGKQPEAGDEFTAAEMGKGLDQAHKMRIYGATLEDASQFRLSPFKRWGNATWHHQELPAQTWARVEQTPDGKWDVKVTEDGQGGEGAIFDNADDAHNVAREWLRSRAPGYEPPAAKEAGPSKMDETMADADRRAAEAGAATKSARDEEIARLSDDEFRVEPEGGDPKQRVAGQVWIHRQGGKKHYEGGDYVHVEPNYKPSSSRIDNWMAFGRAKDAAGETVYITQTFKTPAEAQAAAKDFLRNPREMKLGAQAPRQEAPPPPRQETPPPPRQEAPGAGAPPPPPPPRGEAPPPPREEPPKAKQPPPPFDDTDDYTRLGLDPNKAYTINEVRDAYRKRMREYHPDIAGPEHTETAQKINAAFDRWKKGMQQKGARPGAGTGQPPPGAGQRGSRQQPPPGGSGTRPPPGAGAPPPPPGGGPRARQQGGTPPGAGARAGQQGQRQQQPPPGASPPPPRRNQKQRPSAGAGVPPGRRGTPGWNAKGPRPKPDPAARDLFNTRSRGEELRREDAYRGTVRGKLDSAVRTIAAAFGAETFDPNVMADRLIHPFKQELNRTQNVRNSFVDAAADKFEGLLRNSGWTIDKGRITNLPNSPFFGDVLEDRRYWRNFTPAQKELVDHVRDSYEWTNDTIRHHGGQLNLDKDIDGQYWTRIVLGKDGKVRAQSVNANTRTFGSEQSVNKGRTQEWMEEGVKNGIDYETDLSAVFKAGLHGKLRTAQDAMFANAFRPLGKQGETGLHGYRELTRHPAFRGIKLESDIADKLEAILEGRRDNFITKFPKSINAVLTPLRAGLDLSGMLQQGMAFTVMHPTRAPELWIEVARSLGNPDHYHRLIKKLDAEGPGMVAHNRWGAHYTGRDDEQLFKNFARWATRGQVETVPVLGKLAQKSNEHFARLLNSQRMVMGNSAYKRMIDQGLSGRQLDDAMRENWNAINRATGWSGRKPSSVEEMFVFAPRYTSATIEQLVAAVSKGGMEGSMARKHLLMLAGEMTGLVFAVNYMRGYETETDPRNPNWMRIRDVGGLDISPFGSYDVLIRGAVGTALGEEGDSLNPLKSWNWDRAARFAWAKESPALKIATETLLGETFMGEPLDTLGSREGFVKSVTAQAKSSLPFTAQNLIEEGPVAGAIGATGLTSSPVTFVEKRDFRADKVAQERYGRDYDELSGAEKSKVNEDPEIQKWQGKQEDREIRRAGGGVSQAQRTAREEIRGAARFLEAGEDDEGNAYSGSDFRDSYHDTVQRKLGAFSALPAFKDDPDQEAYFATYEEAKRADGSVDYEKVEELQQALLAKKPGLQEKIDRLIGAKDEPIVRELRAAQKDAREYYKLPAYLGMTLEESREAQEIISEANAMVSYGLAANRNHALSLLSDRYPDAFLLTRLAQRLGPNPDRKNFRETHPGFAKFYSGVAGVEEYVEQRAS